MSEIFLKKGVLTSPPSPKASAYAKATADKTADKSAGRLMTRLRQGFGEASLYLRPACFN